MPFNFWKRDGHQAEQLCNAVAARPYTPMPIIGLQAVAERLNSKTRPGMETKMPSACLRMDEHFDFNEQLAIWTLKPVYKHGVPQSLEEARREYAYPSAKVDSKDEEMSNLFEHVNQSDKESDAGSTVEDCGHNATSATAGSEAGAKHVSVRSALARTGSGNLENSPPRQQKEKKRHSATPLSARRTIQSVTPELPDRKSTESLPTKVKRSLRQAFSRSEKEDVGVVPDTAQLPLPFSVRKEKARSAKAKRGDHAAPTAYSFAHPNFSSQNLPKSFGESDNVCKQCAATSLFKKWIKYRNRKGNVCRECIGMERARSATSKSPSNVATCGRMNRMDGGGSTAAQGDGKPLDLSTILDKLKVDRHVAKLMLEVHTHNILQGLPTAIATPGREGKHAKTDMRVQHVSKLLGFSFALCRRMLEALPVNFRINGLGKTGYFEDDGPYAYSTVC